MNTSDEHVPGGVDPQGVAVDAAADTESNPVVQLTAEGGTQTAVDSGHTVV